jgi:hypothetical protein
MYGRCGAIDKQASPAVDVRVCDRDLTTFARVLSTEFRNHEQLTTLILHNVIEIRRCVEPLPPVARSCMMICTHLSNGEWQRNTAVTNANSKPHKHD